MSGVHQQAKRTKGQTRQMGTVDLVSYRELLLDAPINDAWRRAIDYPSWQGYTNLEHVSGPAGQEGEVCLISKPEGVLVWQPKYIRTVKLDPPRQVIWKIYSPMKGSKWDYEFTATVEYRLTQKEAHKTQLAIQVIKEYLVPYAHDSELDEVRRREYALQHEYEDWSFRNLEALLAPRTA
jgi:hypothetical protein